MICQLWQIGMMTLPRWDLQMIPQIFGWGSCPQETACLTPSGSKLVTSRSRVSQYADMNIVSNSRCKGTLSLYRGPSRGELLRNWVNLELPANKGTAEKGEGRVQRK